MVHYLTRASTIGASMLGVQWSPRRSSALGYQYKYLEALVRKNWMVELEEREGLISFWFKIERQRPKPMGTGEMWPRGMLHALEIPFINFSRGVESRRCIFGKKSIFLRHQLNACRKFAGARGRISALVSASAPFLRPILRRLLK